MIPVPPSPGRRGLILIPLALLFILLAASVASAEVEVSQPPVVVQANIEGAITRATLEFIKETLDAAEQQGATAIILRIDTPGGGVAETEEIVKLMLNSPLPIIGYVSPAGASALSAGTWILMATDVAAMAPGTTIGSLQPVIIGPEGFEPVEEDKIINAVVEKVKANLVLHGRNESLADAFVRENLNLNATNAVKAGAIEIVASSVDELLVKLDGMVTYYKGITLRLNPSTVIILEPSIRLRALVIITDPVIASILLLLGIYGIIFGISTPGQGAEIFGAIAIALGLVGLGFSVSLVALFLIALGIALLIVEIATPSFGVVGTGGVIAIVLGSLFLAPIRPPEFLITPEAQFRILLILLVPTAAVGAFLLFALYKVLQVRRQKPYHDRIIGEQAVAVDPLGPGKEGYVRVEGELWKAVSHEEVQPGERVTILKREGPVLTVGKKSTEE
jgi:membrane-bound serine protease (ClpP class)